MTGRNSETGSVPKPLDLERLVDEIIRVEYPTYERTSIPQMRNAIIRKKQMIKQILEHRLKSVCEFFLRYKDKPELLLKEHHEYEDELKKKCMPKIEEMLSCIKMQVKTNEEVFVICYEKYNEWLFKLAFMGVLDENSSCD